VAEIDDFEKRQGYEDQGHGQGDRHQADRSGQAEDLVVEIAGHPRERQQQGHRLEESHKNSYTTRSWG